MPVYATRSIIVNTVSGTAIATASPWIPLNIHQTPFNVGFGAIVHGNGDITFKVEHTFDNVLQSGVSARVFTHEDVSAANADIDGNYAFGVRAIRVAVVSASSSAGVHLTVIQVGL